LEKEIGASRQSSLYFSCLLYVLSFDIDFSPPLVRAFFCPQHLQAPGLFKAAAACVYCIIWCWPIRHSQNAYLILEMEIGPEKLSTLYFGCLLYVSSFDIDLSPPLVRAFFCPVIEQMLDQSCT
jgi:hypothetical protein